MSSTQIEEVVTYLSKKYSFPEEEAQMTVREYLQSKSQEKKIGRPEKKKKEYAPSKEDSETNATFLSEVEESEAPKVAYKKIESKSSKGKSKETAISNPLSVEVTAAPVVVEVASSIDVDAKIAEVMRAQAEKFKELMMTKKKVVSPTPAPAQETVQESSAVAVVVEEKKKVVKKKPVTKVSTESVTETVTESVAKVVPELVAESVVDMKVVNEKIAEVMRAQAAKLTQVAVEKTQAPVVVVPAEKKEKKLKKKVVVPTPVVAEPVVAKPVVVVEEVVASQEDEDLMKMMDEFEKSREKEVEVPAEQMVTLERINDETITMYRHEGTLYKKTQSGLLYDRYTKECVGKVDEKGKVTLMLQAVEDELCSEAESGSEDENEYDSE